MQSVCVFFSIEQTKSNAQVCFFLFYRHSMEIRKVVILEVTQSRAPHLFLDIPSQDASYFFSLFGCVLSSNDWYQKLDAVFSNTRTIVEVHLYVTIIL